MKKSVFTITENAPLTESVFRLRLAGDTSAVTAPGQFVNVLLDGFYLRRRREQARYWMYESINDALKNMFYESEVVEKLLPDYEGAVLDGTMDSFAAAEELIDKYNNR